MNYKVVDGTSYHEETSDDVIRVLEACRKDGTRIRMDYGDVNTGKSWGEIYDVVGRVSRSCGQSKIPILLHNKRSMGGGAILDHCIIAIHTSKGDKVLYKSDKCK